LRGKLGPSPTGQKKGTRRALASTRTARSTTVKIFTSALIVCGSVATTAFTEKDSGPRARHFGRVPRCCPDARPAPPPARGLQLLGLAQPPRSGPRQATPAHTSLAGTRRQSETNPQDIACNIQPASRNPATRPSPQETWASDAMQYPNCQPKRPWPGDRAGEAPPERGKR